MDKGISFYFGFNSKPEERIKLIKQAGFNTIITNADPKFNKQNGTIKQQVKLFKKYGLKLSSLHSRYNANELPSFFENCKLGNKLEKNLIKDIKIAHKYGFRCVVVHMSGQNSTIGLERLKRVLCYSHKYNVPIAIENIHDESTFDFIFNNVKDDYLRFCYDAGHQHAFSPKRNYLAEFPNKLIALHLHDNDGTADQHTLNQIGTIDWDWTAKFLSLANAVPLDYELLLKKKPDNLTELECLKLCYKNACELEAKIEGYKSNTSKKSSKHN